MISPCVSLCDNVDGICTGCGRSMKNKFEWRDAVEHEDTDTQDRILSESKQRLTAKQYKKWQRLYDKKKQRLKNV